MRMNTWVTKFCSVCKHCTIEESISFANPCREKPFSVHKHTLVCTTRLFRQTLCRRFHRILVPTGILARCMCHPLRDHSTALVGQIDPVSFPGYRSIDSNSPYSTTGWFGELGIRKGMVAIVIGKFICKLSPDFSISTHTLSLYPCNNRRISCQEWTALLLNNSHVVDLEEFASSFHGGWHDWNNDAVSGIELGSRVWEDRITSGNEDHISFKWLINFASKGTHSPIQSHTYTEGTEWHIRWRKQMNWVTLTSRIVWVTSFERVKGPLSTWKSTNCKWGIRVCH